jgi:hypothetical protein
VGIAASDGVLVAHFDLLQNTANEAILVLWMIVGSAVVVDHEALMPAGEDIPTPAIPVVRWH